MELTGIWPETPRNKLKCNFRALVVFFCTLIVCTIPSLHALLKVHMDIILVIDNLQFTLPILTSILKLGIFWWKIEGMMLVLKMIAQDWARSKTANERTVMINRAQTARFVVTCAYSIMFVSLLLAVILPAFGFSMRYLSNITDLGRPLPIQSYFIFDVTQSPQYEVTFIVQSISMIMAIMPYTGIDNFLGLLVLHICGQLDILKDRILSLHRYTNFRDALRACVMDHSRLLRAISIIDDTFNLMLLILLLYFAILLALYGFLGITLMEQKHDLSLRRVLFLICMVINAFAHVCLYCVGGEIMLARCDEIHHAVYSHKWYNLDTKDARTLILVMARSNKRVYITAGRIVPMTMSTFCNLIKTSAGYVSVLLTTRS